MKAGETVVLDIVARPKSSSTEATDGRGSFEIRLFDHNEVPVAGGSVYLEGPGGKFEVIIDANGRGVLEEIPVGTYTLSKGSTAQPPPPEPPVPQTPPSPFIGKVGGIYDVKGEMGAFSDFVQPSQEFASDGTMLRGESKNKIYSLAAGDQIKVTHIDRQVTNGHSTNKYYEIVQGTILRRNGTATTDETEYHFWIIFEDEVKVELNTTLTAPELGGEL